MSASTAERQTLERQFESQSERLPGSAETARLRREALDAFAAHGFPTRRDEAWRYTDLKPIANGGFDFSAPHPSPSLRANAQALLEKVAAENEAGPRAVFIDGRLDQALSRLDGTAGLRICDLATDWEGSDSAQQSPARFEGHPLAQINTAFTRDGIAVHVSPEAQITEPLLLYFIGSGESGGAQQPRLSIALAPNSALAVVVHCVDAGKPAGWLNLVTQISQAEGSRLTLHRLQEHGTELFHTSLLSAELAKDTALELGYVDLGGRLVRNDIDVKLLDRGAAVDLFGVFVAGTGQHIDNHTTIRHIAAHTTSSEAFRGIADAGGRGVFNGKVIVHRDAQHIDARQSSDNLLLADQAEIDTKPELEIYADDVKCSHGATVGELDAEQLFYLRSRGVGEPAARALLTFAFANTLLRRLEPAGLRARATAKVAAHLPDQGQWEEPA